MNRRSFFSALMAAPAVGVAASLSVKPAWMVEAKDIFHAIRLGRAEIEPTYGHAIYVESRFDHSRGKWGMFEVHFIVTADDQSTRIVMADIPAARNSCGSRSRSAKIYIDDGPSTPFNEFKVIVNYNQALKRVITEGDRCGYLVRNLTGFLCEVDTDLDWKDGGAPGREWPRSTRQASAPVIWKIYMELAEHSTRPLKFERDMRPSLIAANRAADTYQYLERPWGLTTG